MRSFMYEYICSVKRKKPKEETIEETKENLGILSMKKSTFPEDLRFIFLQKIYYFFAFIRFGSKSSLLIKKKNTAFNLYPI